MTLQELSKLLVSGETLTIARTDTLWLVKVKDHGAQLETHRAATLEQVDRCIADALGILVKDAVDELRQSTKRPT